VRIDGFWKKYRAEVDLHRDVSIFIGWNGTGKTTFMNLLLASLRADINSLANYDFSSIGITLRENKSVRNISISRIKQEGPFDLIRYKVGKNAWTIPLISSESTFNRNFRFSPSRNLELKNLKEELSKLLKIASLSVHRIAEEALLEEEATPRQRRAISPIDLRLDKLIQQLTVYQLSLAEQTSKISTTFQKNVLLSMLYDEKFDKFNFQESLTTELTKEKDGLSKAYKELGIVDEGFKGRIDLHMSALKKSLDSIRKSHKSGNNAMTIDEALPLSLLKRTQHVINLSLEAENRKQEILSPIRKFIRILGKFLHDKKIYTNQSGELTVERDGDVVPIPQLSSGEKQLIILLTETLLQRDQPFIFITDEPELSLHIEWQSKVISSIRELNPKSQIIVATHSPEITAGWSSDVFDMESVINHE
jgi:predicted ATPase